MLNKILVCFEVFGLRPSNEYTKMASFWKNELLKMAFFMYSIGRGVWNMFKRKVYDELKNGRAIAMEKRLFC